MYEIITQLPYNGYPVKGEDLKNVSCPTLLIVGELDFRVVKINKQALKHLDVQKQLAVVSGASHLFEEPGKIRKAAQIATSRFKKQLSHIQDLEYRI